ncbi:hypothetical protein HYH03_003287 [Edaphochlamys debaryana]|uniref:Protein kinase domain-containing protein n=1 Tax=Edaphochlamys debaryana TaxID=47281 RepID=A0A836C4T4_9CHLO|nr:hypothetical protein HYH03_003287 [Edaphochlamys debaryana]|eukprot:KAG2499104.1 hypothetical protein HYH03_003287 [Edaphochlamys debaryana]
MIGSALLNRPVLDFQLMTSLWEVDVSAVVTVANLTFVNLSPAYFSPGYVFSQFGLTTERIWAFRRFSRNLVIVNSTLVIPSEELQYSRYWLTYVVSPVPEAQARGDIMAKAAWLGLQGVAIAAVNTSGIYYRSVLRLTAVYDQVRLTDTLGSQYPVLPQQTDLGVLLADTVPLTATNPVINASDLGLALLPNNSSPDEQGRRWILMSANFSLTAAVWSTPGGGPAPKGYTFSPYAALMPGSHIITRSVESSVARLAMGWLVNALGLEIGATLAIRNIMLGELSPRNMSYDPSDPLGALASPLWAFQLPDGYDKTTITNCYVLVSQDELRLLQQMLLPASANTQLKSASGPSYKQALGPAVRSFFSSLEAVQVPHYGETFLTLSAATTTRFRLTNVTFRLAITADGEAPVTHNFTTLGVPPDGPSDTGGSSSSSSATIGIAVGCAVGGAVLLALAGFFIWRRRRAGEGSAYSKYLKGTASAAGTEADAGAAGTSDLAPSSQGITHSSQVLRAGGRASDIEAAERACKDSTPHTGGQSASITMTGVTIGGTSSSGVGASASAGVSVGTSMPSSLPRPTTTALPTGAAAGALLPKRGVSQATDSFEQPPSNTTLLAQHGIAARPLRAPSPQTTPSQTGSGKTGGSGGQSQSPAGGANLPASGATGLEAMHAMIQMLGQGFNDRQLTVHGLLGKGAHGTVYKGTWRGLPVAIKSMIFNQDSNARQQHRPLMEAAISSNLAHPNIVTTYSYELRELEHEFASLSPELARQGGGWRLLIIQEYCDAGPLRRLCDCGFFLTPAKPSPARAKLKLPKLKRKGSPSGGASEGSGGSGGKAADASTAPTAGTAAAAAFTSRASSGSSGKDNEGGRQSSGSEAAQPAAAAAAGPRRSAAGTEAVAGAPGQAEAAGAVETAPPNESAAGGPAVRPPLDDLPTDVPSRPGGGLEAAVRYVEAALMIARGLQHIHDKNIVHGDLNPNNVLLVRTPELSLGFCLKVADFGLSVRMAEGESHLSNLFQGSPYYCAPEVLLSGKVGKSADLYSLGIMLWELQHGQRPPWRMGQRLRSYPALNTAELDFGTETPPRYVRLAKDCFHAAKESRPAIASVVQTLASIKSDLEGVMRGG